MFTSQRRKAVFAGLLIAVMVTAVICIVRVEQVSAVTAETYEKLGVFSDVMKKIQELYVEPVDSKTLMYGAIKGMLDTLDPHSSFMQPEVYTEMQVDTKGSFGGLGIEISLKDGVLTVVSPIEDTPAYKEGIKAGDRILEIDAKTTKNISLIDAVKKLRGPKGTKVNLTVMRQEFTEPKQFTIVRDIINIKSVKWKMLEEGYGMVRISQFQERTTDDLEKGLSELEKASKGGLKGLVLDLRNNPGGLLDQAVKVADKFLETGLIVYTDGRIENQKMRFEARKEGTHPYCPMMVLVNGGSASASEIVAGALQDQHRAVVLGTQTFGKGSVQTIFPLEDGSGLRLTTARYYTPSGRSIQAKGITPDIIMEESEKPPETAEQKIKRIREADLEKHLVVPEETKNKPDQGAKKEVVPSPVADDPQMARAVEYLKTWEIFKGAVK
jgi:carboxyl-terminal processing protease